MFTRLIILSSLFIASFSYTGIYIGDQLDRRLPKYLERQPLTMTIKISSPILHRPTADSFQADILSAPKQWPKAGHATISLSYYGKHRQLLNQGDVVTGDFKLKRPHGTVNPVGPIYELQALQKGIVARGYLYRLRSIQAHVAPKGVLDRLRQKLREQMSRNCNNNQARAVLQALLLGDSSQIDSSTWRDLQRTGTSHLVAISGLHIGMLVGAVLLVGRQLIRCFSLQQRGSTWATWLCQLAAILLALNYGLLAGLSLPTARALALLILVICMKALGITFSWPRLLLAVAVVFSLAAPTILLSSSYYLSFAAVSLLFCLNYGSVLKPGKAIALVKQQFVLVLLMLPITAYCFGQISLAAVPVNIIAIPVTSFLLLPILLLAAALGLFLPSLTAMLWHLSATLVELGLQGLAYVSASNLSAMIFPVTLGKALLWQLLSLLLLLPPGFPGRALILVGLLVLVLPSTKRLAQGDLLVTVVDVGQGTGVLISTANHQLIYDTGPAWPSGDDAGKRYLVPMVAASAMNKLDRLVVSHADLDHAGGMGSVLISYPEAELFSSRKFNGYDTTLCHAGMRWQWDGVVFEFLHPTQPVPKTVTTNSASCVLFIRASGHKLLLSGDVDRRAESALLQRHPNLKADILLAPHHGSASSSSMQWIDQLAPKTVIMTTGYLNRYHLPNQQVVKRYLAAGAKVIDTAIAGALQLHLTKYGLNITAARSERQRVGME